MYHLSVEAWFSAAHYLDGYQGKCENVHGHNYKVKANLVAEELDNAGLSVDFSIVKKALKAVLEELDHKALNELEEFKGVNPSAENIAKFIYQQLNKTLPKSNARLASITIWETDTSEVTYQP